MMNDFLYATDLHGNHSKYRQLLEHAKEHGVYSVVLGGDILPKSPFTIAVQEDFIKGFLGSWFGKCARAGVKVYWQYGNDDCACTLPLAKEASAKWDHVNMGPYAARFGNGLAIVGFPWVLDYPFGLKDWCMLDFRGWRRPYFPSPVTTLNSRRFESIPDIDAFLEQRQTIEEALLEQFGYLRDLWPTTVFVSHEPPFGTPLDMLWNGKHIGSRSILNFLQEHDILLSLHGHIHESPRVSGAAYTHFGRTLCIQPGDTHAMHMTIEGNDEPRILGSIEFGRK